MNKDKNMKDGYYLSTYISVDKDGNVYDFSANRHDFNIALWKKNRGKIELIRYWELERQTRLKHHRLPFFDSRQADEVISGLLRHEGLTLDDINDIWGSPHYDRSEDAGVLVSGFYCHSISHLFSSLLMDTDIFYNETILGMALDLRADNETEKRIYGADEYVGCVSRKGEIEYFNIASPALLWFVLKKECNMEEGSLMALASATKCRKVNLVPLEERMLFKTLDYELGYEIYHTIVDDLSEETVVAIDPAFTLEDNLLSAAVKEVNRISQYIMKTQIDKIVKDYGLDVTDTYFALSGGYGLNCPNNSWVMREFGFKGFLGAPCMNDSGESLGRGLFMMYSKLGRFDFKLNHAFYGDVFDETDILQRLSDQGFINCITDIDAETFVNDLSNNVIVWVDGAAEIGPRSLGHRSLLGDPRYIETKDELNRIKQRQFWRPVAPIILEEFTEEWFEDMYVSPYMLQTSQIRKEKAEFVPAILHLDGSSRLQTLNSDVDNNKLLYTMIYEFYKQTGVPIVCNTSLNDRGEPICNRPCEALHFALKKHIKIAYINGKRIELANFDKYDGESKFEPEFSITPSKQFQEEYIRQSNPYGVSIDVIKWKGLFPDYDISTKDGARALKRAVEMSIKQKPILERVYDED